MKKTKSVFSTACLILLSIATVLSLFLLAIFRENPNFFRRRMTEEERMQFIEAGNRAFFAQNMFFDNNSPFSTFSIVNVIFFDSNFDDIVFVETWQEGLETDLPDNIIVAWPTPYSIGILEHMNGRIYRSDFDLEVHNLSYPIIVQIMAEEDIGASTVFAD